MIVKVLQVDAREEAAFAAVQLPSGQRLQVQFNGSLRDFANDVNAKTAARQVFAARQSEVVAGMEIDCGDASEVPAGSIEKPVVLSDVEIARAIYRANFAWLKRRAIDEQLGLPDPDPERTIVIHAEVIAAREKYPHFEEIG